MTQPGIEPRSPGPFTQNNFSQNQRTNLLLKNLTFSFKLYQIWKHNLGSVFSTLLPIQFCGKNKWIMLIRIINVRGQYLKPFYALGVTLSSIRLWGSNVRDQRMWIISSLPLLSGPLWPVVILVCHLEVK